MIKSLLAKLKEEAAAEADHKAWCDGELKSNKLKRDKKTSESEKTMAQIEEMTATIETMGEEIVTLIQEQKDLTSAMGEATADRNAEKAENKATIADAQAGAAAVKSALVVLRNFYSAQSFVQEKQVPEMASYGGMQSAKGGVVGMLEVIVSDFVRLEAETKAAETSSAAEYDSFMQDAERVEPVRVVGGELLSHARLHDVGPFRDLEAALALQVLGKGGDELIRLDILDCLHGVALLELGVIELLSHRCCRSWELAAA